MSGDDTAAGAALAALHRYVAAQTGFHYYEDRPDDFAARVQRRIADSGARDAAAYLRLVRGDSARSIAERDALIDAVTIGETFFFRFAEQFTALRDHILPLLLRENRERRVLRVWSAACASGAELYSVAILLKHHFADQLGDWSVSLLGTDINARAVAQARRAQYGAWALRSMGPETRRACFDHDGDARTFTLKAEFRDGVTFAVHNLVHSPPPLPPDDDRGGGDDRQFDLVLCRNVLIYFDAPTSERVLTRISHALRPGGWLFLGHAESAAVAGEAADAYETVAVNGLFLYRRRSGPSPVPLWTPPPLAAESVATEPVLFLPIPDAARREPEAAAASEKAPLRSEPLPPLPLPALALPPENVRERARQFLDAGDADGALELLVPLLEAPEPGRNPAASGVVTPRHDAVLHYYAALAFAQQELLPDAEKSLRRALYLDRTLVLAHYQLALLAEGRGDFRLAARSLQTVLKLAERPPGDGPARGLAETSEVTPDELAALARLRLSALERAAATTAAPSNGAGG